MRILLSLLCCAGFSFAAGNPKLNGRWDITVTNEPRHRVWWLELEGVGTANPKGKFVSAYAGDMNVIDELAVDGDEVTFGFKPRGGGHPVYKAKLVGNKLEGTFNKMTWVGVRAPKINEIDDGTWKKGKPVALFNGKDMSGWKALIPDRELGWVVKDGILTNQPKANNLITEAKYWNYELHAEYRVGEHSNSGIGLRGRYEIQILEDFGRPPNTHTNGALYSRVAPKVNASRKAGEWQTYEIRLVGMTVTVTLNGVKVLDKVEIEGLTAVAVDANEGEPGPLILQGDHGSVEFRKLVLTPLTR
ncbi:MAG: DUF1080 domain-containing protein [Candidatus Solibacter usitatus]|nr:DUF1080 domain-containing protein [Candidatus Solibacter usitatus]